jgi:DNA-binding GntR family transcriptional regulator
VTKRKESASAAAPERKGGRVRTAAIHRALRDRICFFDYPPGAILREVRLAEEFGVSRTPIRQALQRLELEGLVDVRDGIGTIVTGVEFAALRSVYALRLRLTELIGDFSTAEVPEAAVAEADRLIERAKRQLVDPDVREFWRIETDRHRMINALIANDALREIHDRFYIQTARVWYGIVETLWAEAIEALTSELVELRRAIVAGDVRAIALVSRNYVSYSVARFERHFAERGRPLPPEGAVPLTTNGSSA